MGVAATWCYILLMILAFLILVIIQATTRELEQVTVENPTYADYDSFRDYEPSCPCTNTAIKFETFSNFTAEPDTICDGLDEFRALCDASRPCVLGNLPTYSGQTIVNTLQSLCDRSQSAMRIERARSLARRNVAQAMPTAEQLNSLVEEERAALYTRVRGTVWDPIDASLFDKDIEAPITASGLHGTQPPTTVFLASDGSVLPARLSLDNSYVDEDNEHENACLFGSRVGEYVVYHAEFVEYTYDTSTKEMSDFDLVFSLGEDTLASCEAKPLCSVTLTQSFSVPGGDGNTSSLLYTDSRISDNGDGTEQRNFGIQVLAKCTSDICAHADRATCNADPRCHWRASPEDAKIWGPSTAEHCSEIPCSTLPTEHCISPNEMTRGLGFLLDAKGVKRNPKCVRSLRRGASVCEARPVDTCLKYSSRATCERNFRCVWTRLPVPPLDPSQPEEFCSFRGLYGLQGAAVAATERIFDTTNVPIERTVTDAGTVADLNQFQAFRAYIDDVEEAPTDFPVSYAPRPVNVEAKVPAPITEVSTGLFAVVKEYSNPQCDCMLTYDCESTASVSDLIALKPEITAVLGTGTLYLSDIDTTPVDIPAPDDDFGVFDPIGDEDGSTDDGAGGGGGGGGGGSTTLNVRLRGSENAYEGRVEVEVETGVWKLVCDDLNSPQLVAAVVCKQLGFSPDGAVGIEQASARFGATDSMSFGLDETFCYGYETNLGQCAHNPLSQSDCVPEVEAFGVQCVDTSVDYAIRLSGGLSTREGRVEVLHDGIWRMVCDDSSDDNDATVICKDLGFTDATGKALAEGEAAVRFGTIDIVAAGGNYFWLDDLQCAGSEASLEDCTKSEWGVHNCGPSEALGVTCYASTQTNARLVGGASANEGTLEVFYNGQYKQVCDDSFDNTDAAVVCAELGYGTSGIEILTETFAVKSSNDYSDLNPFWMDDVSCAGGESSLLSCPFGPSGNRVFGDHNCVGSEAVQLRCPASRRRALAPSGRSVEAKAARRIARVRSALQAQADAEKPTAASADAAGDAAPLTSIERTALQATKARQQSELARRKAKLAAALPRNDGSQRRLTAASAPEARAPVACSVTRTILNMPTDLLRSHIGTKALFYLEAPRPLLNSTDRTWFDTVGDGAKRAMLRSIRQTHSEKNFFDQCAPKSCTYYRIRPLTVVGVITVILGVLGGLSVTIRTVVATVIGFIGPPIIGALWPDLKGGPSSRRASVNPAAKDVPPAAEVA